MNQRSQSENKNKLTSATNNHLNLGHIESINITILILEILSKCSFTKKKPNPLLICMHTIIAQLCEPSDGGDFVRLIPPLVIVLLSSLDFIEQGFRFATGAVQGSLCVFDLNFRLSLTDKRLIG